MKRIIYAVFCVVCAASAGAQSLRGSQASVQKMYTRAVLNDLDFFSTKKGIYESVKDGELVMLSITMDMTLDRVSYPFVLPRTRDVLSVFAKRYREACGERLVVTSAARPRTEQPRNASPQSVHPTGMAIDFRRPAGNCLTYMRSELVQLERQGILEATEERHPVHFHVAVLQRGRFAPAAPRVATAAPTTVAPQTPVTVGPQPATVTPATAAPIVVDSASGVIDSVATAIPSTPSKAKASANAAPAARTYTVKRGDTLSEIAKDHGISVTKLKSLNRMKGSSIRPGQKLRVR